MTVSRIPRRRCDDCGEFAACYDVSLRWYCSDCAPARVVTGRLIHPLEDMAEIASEGPEAAKSVARALRRGAASAFWGEALSAAADRIDASAAAQSMQETGNDIGTGLGDFNPKIVDTLGEKMLEKAKTVEIAYDFPDLDTAYRYGRECGPGWDEQKRKSREGLDRQCKALGYVPCEPRKLNAPDDQRWAVNYLRHIRSDYDEVYRRLQDETWGQWGRRGFVLREQIHQIVKNRVLAEIAARFPELADASDEQML